MSVQPEDKNYVAIKTTAVKHFIAQLGTRLKRKVNTFNYPVVFFLSKFTLHTLMYFRWTHFQ